ncbi:MAG TPA: hypothetical protein VIK01_02065 [Polyangiaceae bacterium]|jgi:hypothetical protein
MEDKLQLTARGHAVCELMVAHGLSLEAACERVELELRTLRQTVDAILAGSTWENVPHAMRAALDAVSSCVQSAYLEEQRVSSLSAPRASA